MKALWLLTLLTYVGFARPSLAQSDGTLPGDRALTNDPVFNKVLTRRVTYPIRAVRSGMYGRIYAGFDIDQRGRIQNVSMLSPNDTGAGFEYEVRAALKRMPPLNPRYSGRYALPVSFVLTNWGERIDPYLPTNKLADSSLENRLVLGEIIFRGSIRQLGIYIPPSQQIVYY